MALWGNKDNVLNGGTVALNYATGVLTGTGTSFGTANYAQVGDVIRIGYRGNKVGSKGTGGTYFGDAVIKSIASTTLISSAITSSLKVNTLGSIAPCIFVACPVEPLWF